MADLSKLGEVYSTAVIVKAEQLIEHDGIERDADHASIFWVKGSAGNRYRVQVVEPFDEDLTIGGDSDSITVDLTEQAETLPYVTCTCPNGLATGGRARCYHGAAVIGLLLAEGDDDA